MRGSITQIGPYRLEEKLGTGGMATVYRGLREGAQGSQKAVAIKVLHPELSEDADHVEMFKAEARLAARLHHPVLVPVRDTGLAERTHYMVMDLLVGQTLADLRDAFRKKKKTFPVGHALWIVAQVLDGLHYAHQLPGEDGQGAGVVHRDVSPRNVFITRSGQVRLVDFGIARSDMREGQTRAGIVKGTVPYMAPEQALAQPVDRRADIFAVGVILHELLTGRAPLKEERTEPQRQALARMELDLDLKAIHLDLRPLVTRALAGKPEDRFQTAEDMAEAARAALESMAPEHDATLLGALASRRKRRKARSEGKEDKSAARAGVTAEAEDGDEAPRKRKKRRAKAAPVLEPLTAEPVEPYPAGPALALVASLILLAGLSYTFIGGAF